MQKLTAQLLTFEEVDSYETRMGLLRNWRRGSGPLGRAPPVLSLFQWGARTRALGGLAPNLKVVMVSWRLYQSVNAPVSGSPLGMDEGWDEFIWVRSCVCDGRMTRCYCATS
jgi:hypothetical protein